MEELKNDKITVIISAHGADLQSIKSAEGREYLWQGDEKYWPRRSPLLFPIVCGLWNGQYRVDGKTYELPRHGFARDMDFDVIEKTESSVTYELTSNEETMKVYPYEFGLNVSYFLNDDMINVVWTVRNMGKEEMHFQIGGHPAFNLPDVGEGDKVEGTLLFDNEQPLTRIIGNTGGCIKPERYDVKTDRHIWAFDEESFADDAVILDKSQVGMAVIVDKEGRPQIGLSFDCPCLGIWTPYGKHAPFLCIEPWYGVHDWAGYEGEFKDKYLMNHLLPGATFMASYEIKVF